MGDREMADGCGGENFMNADQQHGHSLAASLPRRNGLDRSEHERKEPVAVRVFCRSFLPVFSTWTLPSEGEGVRLLIR